MDQLVTPEWLAAHPDAVVLEATQYLPNEGKSGRAAFLAAHIPGARYFDLDIISDVESNLPHMLPSAGRFARLVGELGLSDDSAVVFYDQSGGYWATRGWWMMRLFGHDAVAVLDGGLAAWQRADQPVEAGEPAPAEAGHFTPKFRATWVRGLGDMLENHDLVLDARSAARFAGGSPEPRPGLQPGHIPGAVNVPSTTLLASDGTFLPPEILRAKLQAAGADGSRPVVASCGSGISATMIAFAMVRAGLPQPAIYDGSWSEWGASPLTRKETS